MTDSNPDVLVTFETSGPVAVAVMNCKDLYSLDQLDLLLDTFKKQIDALDQNCLILDFSAVRFVATSAINMLLVILKRMRLKGGDVCLCGVADNVQQVFNLMQLNKLFEIFPSQQAALAALEKKNK
jgi:anti-anti-sigma factor